MPGTGSPKGSGDGYPPRIEKMAGGSPAPGRRNESGNPAGAEGVSGGTASYYNDVLHQGRLMLRKDA